MLPDTRQSLIIMMIASAINERLQRKLDYVEKKAAHSALATPRLHGRQGSLLHLSAARTPSDDLA